jgi:hypothetical protein
MRKLIKEFSDLLELFTGWEMSGAASWPVGRVFMVPELLFWTN